MSDLVSINKQIQRYLGVEDDGVIGLITAGKILHFLESQGLPPNSGDVKPAPPSSTDALTFDARTEKVLAGLDPKAVPMFRKFLSMAKATAATFGCDYILVSGNRTYREQDALYAQGRTAPGEIVTKAKGGQSNHNFKIAADAGVFKDGKYLEDEKATKAEQQLAERVHKACSMQAAACGLEWGGNWKSIVDQPHYEVSTGLTLAQKRDLFDRKGSVL